MNKLFRFLGNRKKKSPSYTLFTIYKYITLAHILPTYAPLIAPKLYRTGMAAWFQCWDFLISLNKSASVHMGLHRQTRRTDWWQTERARQTADEQTYRWTDGQTDIEERDLKTSSVDQVRLSVWGEATWTDVDSFSAIWAVLKNVVSTSASPPGN